MPEVVLASASPRRRELLSLLLADFRVEPSEADETIPAGTEPREAVEELARRKARQVAGANPGALVIGADTVVVLEGEILGKPENAAHAAEMLRALSGREHRVFTGTALLFHGEERVFSEGTAVRFAPLAEGEIAAYVATGEPMDKAGAYGIQGKAALFVEGIKGDYSNVVGLPVRALYREMRRFLGEQSKT